MFKDILKDYKNHEYVYIIDGCISEYVSYKPASLKACPICGDNEWDITSGLVKDLRRINNEEELDYYNLHGHVINNNDKNLKIYRKKLTKVLKKVIEKRI